MIELIITIVVILAIGVLIYQTNKQPIIEKIPQPVQAPMKKDMTLDELKQYNGITDTRVFLGVKGVIMDVSASQFYRPQAAYGVFAGHDASINLAKMSHDKEFLNKYGEIELNNDELGILNDWSLKLEAKYPIVGRVIK